MRRREFISIFCGLTATWPLVASAQTPKGVQRVGMLSGFNDPELKAFQQQLEEYGWSEGQNIHVDLRYALAAARAQTVAKQLVASQPAVIFAQSRPITAALQKETHTIPIVFAYVIDPIGAGFAVSLRRPGGNITGVMAYESSMVGKWLSMLKEATPQTSRVALLGNPKTAVYYDYLLNGAKDAAPSFGIDVIPAPIENDAADVQRTITAIAETPNSSMVAVPDVTAYKYTSLTIKLAEQYRLPVVYSFKSITQAGGLMSYGIVPADHYRQAAIYVDKILRGAKPADLPIQTPIKYEAALNLKTARAIGLTPPLSLIAAVDEVIE